MKSKEEIEELVLERFKHRMYNPFFNVAFVEGYIQCQEDIGYSWTKNCECDKSTGQTWCCDHCGLPYNKKNDNWDNFETELMDWAHNLGQEQKYTPFPSQVLEWLKKNYKLPSKK